MNFHGSDVFLRIHALLVAHSGCFFVLPYMDYNEASIVSVGENGNNVDDIDCNSMLL